MVEKGLLQYKRDGEKKYYHNAMWVIGIYEFQVNKMSKEFLEDVSQFGREVFGKEFQSVHIPPLRVIPVGKSFTTEHQVSNYDDFRKLIERAEGPFMVANCVCRQAEAINGEDCKVTDRMETCLGFGTYVKMYLENGWGREITKKEALEIIALNEEDGLVLQPNNSQELDFICSCCGCCCGILTGAKKTNNPVELFSTNFFTEVNHDLCTLCEVCIKRCQMDAIRLEDGILEIDLKRCIGCGNCIASCPSGALVLRKKGTEEHLPKDVSEMYSIIQSHKEKRS
jgi:ferredoxin